MAEIRLFAGSYAPNGWHLCDGTMLFIHRNRQLFDLIGKRYGGDGFTTFALPDLRGRTVLGASIPGSDVGGYETGSFFGQETVGLGTQHMPNHSHNVIFDKDSVTPFRGFATLYGSFDAGGKSSPEGNFLGVDAAAGAAPYASDGTPVQMHADAISFDNVQVAAPKVRVGFMGGQQPHNNMMPSLVLQYIICMNGIYPSPG